MILREPFSLTFALIVFLNIALGGSLFGWFYEAASAICHAKNERLVTEGKQGPLQRCL